MSIAKGIPALAAERAPRYAAWADAVVENDTDPEIVAERVVEAVQKVGWQ